MNDEILIYSIVQVLGTVFLGSVFIPWFWGIIQSRRLMFTLLLEFKQNIIRFQRFSDTGKSLIIVSENVWDLTKSNKNIMNWFLKNSNNQVLNKIEIAFDHLHSKQAKIGTDQEKKDDWKFVQGQFIESYSLLKDSLIANKSIIIWPFCWIPKSKHRFFKVDE